jgi:hypothetical protein
VSMDQRKFIVPGSTARSPGSPGQGGPRCAHQRAVTTIIVLQCTAVG